MAFKLIHLVILCIGGCNAGVVPQHFISNHTEPVNVKIERVPTDFDKIESNSTFEIKADVSTIVVGDEDLHNSSEVSIVGFHNISKEPTLPKLNASEESHPIISNHSKEFDHSQKGDTKGSGRPRKKPSKGSNRFKKSTSKETKNFEKVTKGHFHKDSVNKMHNLEDIARELSHTDEDFLKKSDHAEDVTEDHFKDSLNGSHHAEDFMKESNHSDKDVSKMTSHAENITNITFNQKAINGSDQSDDHFNNFNNLLNESHHHEAVLNHSNSDVSKGFLQNDNVTKLVHQVEQNASRNFENAPGTRNETLKDFEIITDFQINFDNTSGTLDVTAESSSNSSKIIDDHIAFLHLANNISIDTNPHHDPSDFKSFQEDHIDKIDIETQSENTAPEMNPLIRQESFNSSKTALADGERLSFGMDIHISNTKENSSDLSINQTLLDMLLHEEDGSTLRNHQLNETNSNDAYVMFTVSPNEDDTNSSTELSHEFLRDLEVNTDESKLQTETNNSTIMTVEENATQGLFSGISFDFLLNSELAKNAASAMEVFNFTDSAITDHIVDKNDVHDFLDLIHPSEERDQSVSKEEFHGSMEERDNLNVTEMDSGLNSTSEDGVRFQAGTTTLSPTLLNSTVDFEETTMVSHLMLNSTVDFEETTMVSQPMLNSTVDFEETTTVASHSFFNSTVEFEDAICPPPGICIFWFLAQDTCAVNNHCLGSRICCRIGCAKTCIEV